MKQHIFKGLCFILVICVTIPMTGAVGYAAEPKRPIKIGLMLPVTGVFASIAEDIRNGFNLYLKQIGFKAGGHEIEIVIADDKANPAEGLIKIRELVEREKVDILSGFVHSGMVLAERDYVVSKKIPSVIVVASSPPITQEKKSPYFFRVYVATGQEALVAGWYAYTKLGIKKAIFIGSDYSFGRDNASAFKKFFTQSGGILLDEMYPVLGTADYGPFLARILGNAEKADACIVVLAGADALRFIKQYAEYGLKKKLPILAHMTVVENTILPAEGDDAVGIKYFATYTHTVDSNVNNGFVRAYINDYKSPPNLYSENAYVAAKVIVEAIKALEGDISNISRLLEAMRLVQFEAPRGPFRFDKDQNAIVPVFIGEIRRKPDGELYPANIDMIPNVDQYWRGSRYEQNQWR